MIETNPYAGHFLRCIGQLLRLHLHIYTSNYHTIPHCIISKYFKNSDYWFRKNINLKMLAISLTQCISTLTKLNASCMLSINLNLICKGRLS